MTTVEFVREFDLRYDNKTNNEGEGFTAFEKSLLFTQAQEKVYEQLVQSSEIEELYKKVLSPLKKNSNIITTSGVYANERLVVLPTDYGYTLSERAFAIPLTANSCHSLEIAEDETLPAYFLINKIKPITEDYYAANLNNPYKKPYYKLVWRREVEERPHSNI